jgi:hypothetical protein
MTPAENPLAHLERLVPKVKRGTFVVWRVNGLEEIHDFQKGVPKLLQIYKAIGSDGVDGVTLSWSKTGVPDLAMMVPDRGMLDNLPVNQKGTALYMWRCAGRNTTAIHGDVAIAHDGEF